MIGRTGVRAARGFAVAVLATLLLLASVSVEAVPRYSARYGQKCSLCHVNPTGGGLRTLYASQYIVPEEMAWSKPEEGLLTQIDPEIAKRILIGTDFRLVHTYTDTDPPPPQNNFFEMQGDIYLNFQMDDQLSLYYDHGISTSYELFGMWQGLPLTGYVKLGRFVPAYGWRFDDHTMYVRDDLGFFPPANSDVGVEFGISPKRFDVQFAVVNGNRGATADNDRKLASVFSGGYRWDVGPVGMFFGAAGYWEDGNTSNFGTAGGFGYLNWKRASWVGQMDWTLDDPEGSGHRTGFVTSHELSFLLRQGLELLGTYDFSDPDYNLETGARSRWGGGASLMPRPFLVVQALVRATSVEQGVDVSGEDFWETLVQFHLLY